MTPDDLFARVERAIIDSRLLRDERPILNKRARMRVKPCGPQSLRWLGYEQLSVRRLRIVWHDDSLSRYLVRTVLAPALFNAAAIFSRSSP